MSHATGTVFNGKDNPIAYFLYNGSSDFATPKLYTYPNDAWIEYGLDEYSKIICTCGNDPISVELFADYGSGIQWSGEVCMTCMCITKGFDPYKWQQDSYLDDKIGWDQDDS